MAILSPSFLLGLIFLFYLLSFIFFAVIRIATGVSIQRPGYLSLRRIAYTPRDGIRIDLRGLGLRLHRPTFAQPTWVSLRLTGLKVTIDTVALNAGQKGQRSGKSNGNNAAGSSSNAASDAGHHAGHPRTQTWRKLTNVKEKIKALHGMIDWLSLVDLELLDVSCIIVDIGSVQIGSATAAVDVRRRSVDRGRLFSHKKSPTGVMQPAEWMFVVKSVLFVPAGRESLEILDTCSLNIHGFLHKDLAGLRDASISLKLGRIHIPCDDIIACQIQLKRLHLAHVPRQDDVKEKEVSSTGVIQELIVPGNGQEEMTQTVPDSKEFISSTLRGIQEIQLAVSFVGLTKEIEHVQPAGRPVYINLSMNEIGLDLFCLDPKSPAHRMYFSSTDIAHQALIAAISIALSIDDGSGKLERLIYVPMATTTIKTTLPSKILVTEDEGVTDRNANMLFASFVLTSPSLDIDLKHMPVMFALLQDHRRQPKHAHATTDRHHLVSQLLPKASVKISVQEPVVRVVLPPANRGIRDTDEYDLLITSISSISLDLESSHASAGELHYALSSILRLSSQQLYYQAADGERHNLLQVETLELKIQVAANPDITVVTSGSLDTVSAHLVRPEISKGIYRILQQARRNSDAHQATKDSLAGRQSVLRRLPPWLVQAQFKGSNFGIEVAGIDSEVSEDLRGAALQLESWSAEYTVQRTRFPTKPQRSRRTINSSVTSDEIVTNAAAKSTSSAGKGSSLPTDGRRLAVHVAKFEGYIVEGVDVWEPQPFVSVPRFEIALSTSSDGSGPMMHVNSHVKALYMHYSLYRYYAIGIAHNVLRRAFDHKVDRHRIEPLSEDDPDGVTHHENAHKSTTLAEITTVDIKTALLQVKATMPTDPPLMLQLYGLHFARHRWAAPFVKTQLARLYAEVPRVKSAWARIASLKNARVDIRESRKKVGSEYIIEKSVDVVAEYTRLAVPHQLIMHNILDNFVNVLKATEQLQHRFDTGTNEYVLKKHPEGPKCVPRVSLRSRALMFELEDGSFDWKLGLIYRVGLNEQKQRIAREEAFRVKVKKLDEQGQRRDNPRFKPQAQSQKSRGRTSHTSNNTGRERSGSPSTQGRQRSSSRSEYRARSIRYDTEAVCDLSASARISTQEAWLKLQEHNASSWKKRITFAMRFQNSAMKDVQGMFWEKDVLPENAEEPETIIAVPNRPGLMTTMISDLHIVIDKPSFPLNDYSKFLHDVGKGMPFDTQYSLLIPMSLQINMGETRVSLRNYPLPLLHVPALKRGQSSKLPSWSLKTDFVIAEEFRDDESIRHARVEVVPPDRITSPPQVGNGFAVDVRRTVSPVKTFSNIDISINTSNATSIAWGTSYQPAIQEMMQTIEGFTKPQLDPSDRVGFWDKIRLSFHSRVTAAWKGDGEVLLKLKGSRDPYVVTGHGSGFVMCFRNNVKLDICQDDDPKKFMSLSCGEYVLAIPDYSYEARQNNHGAGQDTESITLGQSHQQKAMFNKVAMKLSGNVRWLAGLVFERNLDEGGRSFEFSPHYNVTLKAPAYAKPSDGRVYDAFRNFRSHHIHLSIAIIAPLDRDWSVTNLKPSASYNSIHLTPRLFTHFYDWWATFSGVMALPIHQGRLFPGIEKTSKKFGRHLATIKFNILLSPLFIAHIYKHKDVDEYDEDAVGATGLKLRMDSFMLDIHQRREEFAVQSKSRDTKDAKTSGMRINEAQLDFISADLRAISATMIETSPEGTGRMANEDLASPQEQGTNTPDFSRFTVPDDDHIWIDMDDFVEHDWIVSNETHTDTKIMPLAFSPRFTYFRQTEHHGIVNGDITRTSPFGSEPTHFCVMSQDNDPQRVQRELVRTRIATLTDQLEGHQRTLGEQELRVVRDSHQDPSVKDEYDMLLQQGQILEDKKAFMQHMLEHLSGDAPQKSYQNPSNSGEAEFSTTTSIQDQNAEHSEENREQHARLAEYTSEFNNRFTVHNIQLKWNNALRNVILRYVHQVSQRRGFVYYMSRSAVKFILDILEERQRSKQGSHSESESSTPSNNNSQGRSSAENGDDTELEHRIQELLLDGKGFVNADDHNSSEASPKRSSQMPKQAISDEFEAVNSYHLRLIAPQIQLQSEKNPNSVLIVTARGMQMKVIQIMDKTRTVDDVSGLVQRRFSLDMDGVQFFVTNKRTLVKFLHVYSAHRYGAPKGSVWPPWTPLEVNFDFSLNPLGWFRVVQKTSASLRYDKYNTLRLKLNDEITKDKLGGSQAADDAECRIDHLWVEFPHVRAICDSSQYYTMFIIVSDLLLYSEPMEKRRSERLEKIMLAADFSDLSGTPEMIINLQERIRQLLEIKGHFQLHATNLDRQGWEGRFAIEQDLANCEEELFFTMKAITTAQRKHDDRIQASQTNGLLRWNLSASEIVWHLMREHNEPLVEFQLKDAAFDRTDNSDGSNYNTVEIGRIHGLNLLPNAVYPQMIAPYFEHGQSPIEDGERLKMFKVQWYMLEAIAGIPVLDQFEVNLFPLKVQLEKEVGKKLFEYIFPGNGTDEPGETSDSLPFLVRHLPTVPDEMEGAEGSLKVPSSSSLRDLEQENQQSFTRSGLTELRLKPTLMLSEAPAARPSTSASMKSKGSSNGTPDTEPQRFKFFQRPGRSKSASRSQTSLQSLSTSRGRLGDDSSMYAGTIPERPMTSLSTTSLGGSDKSKRFALNRTPTTTDKEDDISKMMSRASSYMTLAYVKVPSVVLCLSYKGKGERNIEDVHDFVFRMPTLEYRNKTWSNLDLAQHLKKDVIRALISHTGAIIGNKFSHHRPNKMQQNRLREIANSSSLLPNTNTITNSFGRTTHHRPIDKLRPDPVHETNNIFIAGLGTSTDTRASTASGFHSPHDIGPGESSPTISTISSSDNSIAESSAMESSAGLPSIGTPEGGGTEETILGSSNEFLGDQVVDSPTANGDVDGLTPSPGLESPGNTGVKSRRPNVLSLGKKIFGTHNEARKE